jgi:hypothetical protein
MVANNLSDINQALQYPNGEPLDDSVMDDTVWQKVNEYMAQFTTNEDIQQLPNLEFDDETIPGEGEVDLAPFWWDQLDHDFENVHYQPTWHYQPIDPDINVTKEQIATLMCNDTEEVMALLKGHFSRLPIQLFRWIIEQASRQDIESFLEKCSSDLDAKQRKLGAKVYEFRYKQRLMIMYNKVANFPTLTELCCQYFRKPTTPGSIKEQFYNLKGTKGFERLATIM